jgi:hypothetical protein
MLQPCASEWIEAYEVSTLEAERKEEWGWTCQNVKNAIMGC